MITTKSCSTCEHFPNDRHCVGCVYDEAKGENTKWELKKNSIVIERAVLDKIRAEIKGMYRVILKDTPKDDWAVRWNDCLDDVLQIIDKYKAESEV